MPIYGIIYSNENNQLQSTGVTMTFFDDINFT